MNSRILYLRSTIRSLHGEKLRDASNPFSSYEVLTYMDEYARTDDAQWIRILGYARNQERKNFKSAINSAKDADDAKDKSSSGAGGAATGTEGKPPGAWLGEEEAYVQRQKIKDLEAEVARLKKVPLDPGDAKQVALLDAGSNDNEQEVRARVAALEQRFLERFSSTNVTPTSSMMSALAAHMGRPLDK